MSAGAAGITSRRSSDWSGRQLGRGSASKCNSRILCVASGHSAGCTGELRRGAGKLGGRSGELGRETLVLLVRREPGTEASAAGLLHNATGLLHVLTRSN